MTSLKLSRRPPGLTLAAACLLVLAVLIVLAIARGPFWLGTNLDPDYAYLFNGLLIATGRPPQHVDHPGSTIQLLIAAVLRGAHLTASRETLITAVLDRPEFYLQITRGILLAGIVATLLAAGAATVRATGRAGAGVFVILTVLLTPTILREVIAVKPEPGILMAGLGLGAMALLAAGKGATARLASGMGIAAALAVTTKITALPLLVLPLVVLGTWRLRGLYLGTLLLATSVLLLPAYPRIATLFKLTHDIATTTGRYGNPAWPAASPYGNSVALLLRLGETPVLVLALVVTACGAWCNRTQKAVGVASAAPAFALALALQILLEATHPYESRYLMAGLAISGPALIAGGAALRPHIPAAWSSRSAQQLLAIATGTLATLSVWITGAGFTGDRAALAAQNQLLARYPASEVLDFYSASTPEFAIFFGNAVAGDLFGAECDAHDPTRVFFNLWQKGFASYAAVLSTTHALTSHELILRGATPELWPPLKTNPMFQQRLLPDDGRRTLDGLYKVTVSSDIRLAFGDFVAEGLERPEPLGSGEQLLARRITSRATLRYDAADHRGRLLTGFACNPTATPVTLHIASGTTEFAHVDLPPASPLIPLHVEVPASPFSLAEIVLSIDGPTPKIAFTELHLVSPPTTAAK